MRYWIFGAGKSNGGGGISMSILEGSMAGPLVEPIGDRSRPENHDDDKDDLQEHPGNHSPVDFGSFEDDGAIPRR